MQFADLESTMNTQFDMLLGNLPAGYRADPLVIVYVVLTNLVMFFLVSLMLVVPISPSWLPCHFVLANL